MFDSDFVGYLLYLFLYFNDFKVVVLLDLGSIINLMFFLLYSYLLKLVKFVLWLLLFDKLELVNGFLIIMFGIIRVKLYMFWFYKYMYVVFYVLE